MPDVSGMLFSRIDHVGVAVHDLDAAIAHYERVFGLQTAHLEVNEEQGVREAMLAVGDPPTAYLQLLAPLSATSPIARFLDRHGEGLQQVAYLVDDIEQVSATLRARGVRVLYEHARRGTAGSKINFVHPKDANGVLIELVEKPPTPALND
jgi:methylmalonyl-CoA/ethylmalonyl-CoA epimerase